MSGRILFIYLFQTPKKDNEIILISETTGQDLFELIYYVTRGTEINPKIVFTSRSVFAFLKTMCQWVQYNMHFRY